MGLVLVLIVLLALCVPVFAQESSSVDIAGGYSLARSEGVNAHGWNAEVGGRGSDALQLVGDVSGYYASQSASIFGTSIDADASTYHFLFGPRVFFRGGETVTPFFHALAGGHHSSATAAAGFEPLRA